MAFAILERPSVLKLPLKQLLQGTLSLPLFQVFVLYLDLSLDAIGAVCHLCGLLLVFQHLSPFYTLCRFCRDFQLEPLVPALLQQEHQCHRETADWYILVMVLPPMLTFPSCSFRAPEIILSRKLLKRVGEKKKLYRTPTIVLYCHSSEPHL